MTRAVVGPGVPMRPKRFWELGPSGRNTKFKRTISRRDASIGRAVHRRRSESGSRVCHRLCYPYLQFRRFSGFWFRGGVRFNPLKLLAGNVRTAQHFYHQVLKVKAGVQPTLPAWQFTCHNRTPSSDELRTSNSWSASL